MKILFATSESLPFVSTGGLADVSESLPHALNSIPDVDVRVVLPYYSAIKNGYEHKVEYLTSFTVTLSWRRLYCGVFKIKHNGVIYYFLDNEYYFKRFGVYGDFDDGERFAFFSKAILDLMSAVDFFPDVLHANDWQTALSIPYLKKIYFNDHRYRNIFSVFTIHNVMYQGRYGKEIYKDILGLPEGCMSDVMLDGDVNFMKGAIQTSDRITTVSPTYRDELLSGYNSFGMDKALTLRQQNFCGILNGIDLSLYPIKKDKMLSKKELQKELNLKESENTPIIAIVSRLCEQKGLSIIKPSLERIMSENVQLAVLGKGDYMDEEFFKYLQRIYPEKISVTIDFNKELSKLIYAGSDILLMPSLSEPCGISQMIACHYGTVPVTRETGGLRDTVRCYDPNNTENTNGFTFYEYSERALTDTIHRTLELYSTNEWNKLVKRCMDCDFSWDSSAKKYIEVYSRI